MSHPVDPQTPQTPPAPPAPPQSQDGAGRPLRRTRGDLIATGVIAGVAVLGVAGVLLTAPANQVAHHVAQEELSPPPVAIPVPQRVSPAWSATATPLRGVTRPLVTQGLVIVNDDHGVRAVDTKGQEVWSYSRDRELCSTAVAWDKVIVTYRDGLGCGDVVALRGTDGAYARTRSAYNGDPVWALSSNDNVGTVARNRVELWRSDLVRTVEYGQVIAKQEPNLQPHEDCAIDSALTRKDLLAVTETCPADKGSWLRLQKTTPKQSRKPEILKDIKLDGPAAVVAVSATHAAVYVGGSHPRIISFAKKDGSRAAVKDVAASPWADQAAASESVFAAATADMTNNMSWFDGSRLYLFDPENLAVTRVLDDAIGTGVMVSGSFAYPTKDGLRVINPKSGQQLSAPRVDRPEHPETVYLGVAQDKIIERRGDTVVALQRDL